MTERIEFIYLKGNYRLLGVEIREVHKIIPPLFNLGNNEQVPEQLKQQENFYTLKSFFPEETEQVNSLVYITASNRTSEIILGVPGEIEIFKIPLSDIMILPAFMRKKQNPLFCWGFIQETEKLVMLVTFSRFIAAFGRNPISSIPVIRQV